MSTCSFRELEKLHLSLADDKLQDSAGGVSQGVKRRKKFRPFPRDSCPRDKLHFYFTLLSGL